MPFFPYVKEAEQAAQLVPRKGWECDGTQAAPVVFRDRNVVGPADFQAERQQLLSQTPILRAYAEAQLAAVPGLLDKLGLVAARPLGGDVLLGLATLLTHWPDVDAALSEFTHRYRQWGREMARRGDS